MVWFKWPAVTAQQIAASATAAKNLTKIEGVLSVDFGAFFLQLCWNLIPEDLLTLISLLTGTNFCDRSRDFNLGLYVRFASKEALDFYQPHPIHEEFKATVAQKDGTYCARPKEGG